MSELNKKSESAVWETNSYSQVSLPGRDKGAEFLLVLGAHILNGKNSSGLLVHNSAKTSLALHNHIGYTHLAAKCRQVNDKFNRVDIISDDDKAGLLCLNESDAVVQAVLDEKRLLLGLGSSLLLLSSCLRRSLKTGLLLLLRLRTVLVQELEKLGRSVFVEGVRELCDGRGDLETLVKDDLLALKADVLRPLDEAGEISLRLDVLACGNYEYQKPAL